MRHWRAMALAAVAWAAAAGADENVPAGRRVAALDIADLAAPAFSVYGVEDGLSDEIWSTVGFDRDGHVWAGSASALARFDGYRWTPWPYPRTRSLVRDLESDPDGNLWAIFEGEGLARLDGERWTRVGPERFVQRFSRVRGGDGREELWASDDDGPWRLEAGEWRLDPGSDSLAGRRAIDYERTARLLGGPREWLGTTDGLLLRETRPGTPAPWQRHEAPELAAMMVTDVLRTHDRGREELWVLSYGGGVARLRDDGLRVWRSARGELPTEATYSAVATHSESGERTLWIASRAGLLRIRGDEVTTFDRRHGLPSDAVRGIKRLPRDGVDLLWLATEGGLARTALTQASWQTVSLHGARENGVMGLLVESDEPGAERLWVGSAQQGLALLEHGEWRRFTQAEGTLPAEGVRQILRLPGPDGATWRLIGLQGGGLLRVDASLRFVPMATPWPMHAGEAMTAGLARHVDGRHELWLSTQRSGVHRLRDGQWQSFLPPGTPLPWGVYSLVEQIDADGRSWLWAASNRGLARLGGAQWELLPETLGLSEGLRDASLVREHGRTVLWVSTFVQGVARIDVTDPSAPRRLSGDAVPAPPDPTVYSVRQDRRDRVYVCTNNGVQQLVPRADGGWDERVFRRRDGLVHDECNSGSQQIDRHDRYWAGTLGGLSVFDPDLQPVQQRSQPKPLRLTAARVDGAAFGVAAGDALRLPPGTRELRLDYSLLSGLREIESVYRTRLLGEEPEPGAWSTERSRVFAQLAPGDYRLRIEARDFAGVASAPLEVAFTLEPLWWQRRWIQATGALLLLALGAAAVALYSRSLRQRQRQLTREVAQRTAQLNEANARLTELSYADPLTGVANRRRLTEALAAAMERATQQARPVGLIVIDVDHFKDYNDRHGHLAGDAALRAIAQALQSATREQDLVARFGGEEFACLLIDADAATVARIAERMRALVEALPPRTLGNDSQTITISAGRLSRVPHPDEQPADLLAAADAALYRAKREGRNRVCDAA